MRKSLQIFWSFFKIGAFTLGGGYAMLALIRREVVERRQWINDDDFVNMLAIAQTAPGPIALNTAIFTGYRAGGGTGILFSCLGIILPSFIIILAIAIFFTDFKELPAVEKVFKGIRPVVVALIAAPLLSMGKTAGVTLRNCWIPVGVALLVWGAGISPVYIILAAIGGSVARFLIRQRRTHP